MKYNLQNASLYSVMVYLHLKKAKHISLRNLLFEMYPGLETFCQQESVRAQYAKCVRDTGQVTSNVADLEESRESLRILHDMVSKHVEAPSFPINGRFDEMDRQQRMMLHIFYDILFKEEVPELVS